MVITCDASTSPYVDVQMPKPIAEHSQLGILWDNQFTNEARNC